MASFLTTATNFDKSIVPLVSKIVQDTLRAGLGYLPAGSVIPASWVPGTNGTFRSFAFDDLSRGTGSDISDGQADPDHEALTLEYVEFDGGLRGRILEFSDNAEMQSPFNLAAIAAEKVGYDVVNTLDEYARAAYAAGANLICSGSGNVVIADVALGDTLAAKDILRAVATLRMDKVKPITASGHYCAVVSPAVMLDLRQDDDFVDQMRFAAPETFVNGAVASYGGVDFVETANAYKTGTGTSSATVYLSTIIGRDAVFGGDLGTVTVQIARGPDKSDPLDRKRLVGWKGAIGLILNSVQTPRYVNIASASTL